MPGIASASLMGFAIPIASGAAWEHTYAESSCGLSWGCWGRNAGGRPLGNAMGSSIIADCLSQLNSRAGLVYGVTAVCHQTANRILHPAGITVALGGGYGTSWSLFRVYGLGPWPQKATCYLSQAASGGPGGSPYQWTALLQSRPRRRIGGRPQQKRRGWHGTGRKRVPLR